MTMLLHILAPDIILHLLLTQLELQHKATSTMIARLIDPHTQPCFRLSWFRLLCFRLPLCLSVVHSATMEHVSRIHTCRWYGSSCRNMHLRDLHAWAQEIIWKAHSWANRSWPHIQYMREWGPPG